MIKQWAMLTGLLVGMFSVMYAPEFQEDDNVEGSELLNSDEGDVENGRELKLEVNRDSDGDADKIDSVTGLPEDVIVGRGNPNRVTPLTVTTQVLAQPEVTPKTESVLRVDDRDVEVAFAQSGQVSVDPNGPKRLTINQNLQAKLTALDPLGKVQMMLRNVFKYKDVRYHDQLQECLNAKNAFNEVLQAKSFDEEEIKLKQQEYEVAFEKLVQAIKNDSIMLKTWSSFKSFFKRTRAGKYVIEFLAKRKARQIVLSTAIGKAVEADISDNQFAQDQLASLVRFTKEVTASIKMQAKDKEFVSNLSDIFDGQIRKYTTALDIVFPKIIKLDLLVLKGGDVNRILDALVQDLKKGSIDQRACAYDLIRQTNLLLNGKTITQQKLQNEYEKWLRRFMTEVLTNIEGGADHLKDLQNKTVSDLGLESSEA